MASMNASSDVVTGKVHIVIPAKNRFPVRLNKFVGDRKRDEVVVLTGKRLKPTRRRLGEDYGEILPPSGS